MSAHGRGEAAAPCLHVLRSDWRGLVRGDPRATPGRRARRLAPGDERRFILANRLRLGEVA